MDDEKFDDIIKKKVGEYQEPGFDPAALADLHYRMSAADAVWPWYSRYRTELFVGAGLALCTLIILWNQMSLSNRENVLLTDNLNASKNQSEQISKLQHEINYLRSIQPDTITVIEYREQKSLGYTFLLNQIAGLEATLKSYVDRSMIDKPSSVADTLKHFEELTLSTDPSSSMYPQRLVPKQMNNKSARALWNEKNTDIDTKERSLSVKAMRDIENHYQKGIGIRIGPTLDISKGFYSVGSGRIDVAGGILADFILSPSLSLETGGKYAHRVHKISDQDDILKSQLPFVEKDLGTPKNVDIDSWILEVPVNLKYRYPISLKSHWLVGVGLSPMLFTRQTLEYDYEFSGNSSATIYSIYKKDKPEFYLGAVNFSWGLSNETKRKNIIETSIYYQYGLGGIGAENIKRSFLGLRGVYWFKIR